VLPPDVHVNFYRIAQEALSNITKHAGASSVHVKLSCSEGSATLSVRDDGMGFQAVDVTPDRLGLQIVRERAEAIGATLGIDSTVGQGTCITVQWSKGEQRT
jgi:signal transduction histidine kinase